MVRFWCNCVTAQRFGSSRISKLCFPSHGIGIFPAWLFVFSDCWETWALVEKGRVRSWDLGAWSFSSGRLQGQPYQKAGFPLALPQVRTCLSVGGRPGLQCELGRPVLSEMLILHYKRFLGSKPSLHFPFYSSDVRGRLDLQRRWPGFRNVISQPAIHLTDLLSKALWA